MPDGYRSAEIGKPRKPERIGLETFWSGDINIPQGPYSLKQGPYTHDSGGFKRRIELLVREFREGLPDFAVIRTDALVSYAFVFLSKIVSGAYTSRRPEYRSRQWFGGTYNIGSLLHRVVAPRSRTPS